MPGGHLGMLGGGASLYVPSTPTPPAGSWATPLQYPAPAGWENFTEIIVEPATGADKNSDMAVWGVKTISLSAGQHRKIVMPMPGDFYGNTTCRRGKMVVNGGGNLVFCVRRADGTYRRGGFSIEMPKFSPRPATGAASPPPKERKAIDFGGAGKETDGRVIDIVGFYNFGDDMSDAIQMNCKLAHLQVQRSRLLAGPYRCAADRSGNNGNVKDGFSTSTTNPYRLGNENAHPDVIQCYTEGYKSIRVHDCTFRTSMGGFTVINSTDWKGDAVIQGDFYLSRLQFQPNYFSTLETLNNFNTGYLNQGRNQANRWYWAVAGDGSTRANPNRVWVDDDVYFARNNAWDPSNGDPAWPGRSMALMMIPSTGFTVYDATTDSPRRVECDLLSDVDDQLCMRRWNRTVGAGTDGTQFGTKGQFRIGDPPGGVDYAPASMWGGDGLSYVE